MEQTLAGSAGVASDTLATPALHTGILTWKIGAVAILDAVTLTAQVGEFVGVIGPNGAGKTSLFNLVSGLHRPTEGRIQLAGTDITTLAPHRRARLGLGRTFQSSAVFGSLSVADNVRLAVAARRPQLGLIRTVARDRQVNTTAHTYLEQVGLAHQWDRPAGLLAHGDKRKLEIAIVLAGDPSVILLDEPLAGVAPADIPGLLDVIGALTRDHAARTVLMVEHHIEAILHLADRVAVFHHGGLLACDTPAAVMSNATVQEAYLGEDI